jgi:hypothetical protein
MGKKDFLGCNLFTKEEGMTAMDINIPAEDYDLNQVAGGPPGIGQIPLC